MKTGIYIITLFLISNPEKVGTSQNGRRDIAVLNDTILMFKEIWPNQDKANLNKLRKLLGQLRKIE